MRCPPAGAADWAGDLATVAEKTSYQRTMTSTDLLEFITALKAKSDLVHVVDMFISPRGKAAPAIVLANPRVTSPSTGEGFGQTGRVPVRQHPSAGT